MLELIFPFVASIAAIVSTIVGILTARKYFRESKERQAMPMTMLPAPIINVDLAPIHKALEAVPHKVLTTIISSSNNLKGNLGELMAFLKLNADYDRIIPLGNIVDFICIKLPKDGKEGHIDFVDIKTGNSAKLSRDQVGLKRLIEEKKIKFIKYKIEAVTEQSVEG